MVVLTLSVIVFIFSNSAKDGKESSMQSDKVVEVVRPPAEVILPIVDVEPTHTNISSIVRTLGHFSEFALLGCIAFWTVRLWCGKKWLRFVVPFGLCVLTAFIDEAIQLTSPGRTWQLQDILVDSAGALCGMLFALLCVLAVRLLVRKRKKEARKCKIS